MKKDLLFVMNNLNCGGAEKAIISLLETIDYSKFNVDLYLFKHEGIFLGKLPTEVNLLNEPLEYSIFDMPIKEALLQCVKMKRPAAMLYRILFGVIIRTEKNKARSEQRRWKYISSSIGSITKKYHSAIGYLEKNPIYFCIDKVEAEIKIGFIHNDYNKLGMDPKLDEKYLTQLNKIVTVSQECANVLNDTFPSMQKKITVMHNIVSPRLINQLSLESKLLEGEGLKIVTIGRLSYQKGYDLALEACKILTDYGLNIKWYVIGEGEDRNKLEDLIKNFGLEANFKLLGLKENPYPYIYNADIYVQSSRFEGKSIAIDEAKILLKPIIVTNFSTVTDQIQDGINGLVASMDAKSIAEKILKMYQDEKLKEFLISNLKKEELGTEHEILKLYSMINDAV
ncbi:glycosyltransferase [Jeotgalibacillus proteolyticus]|uniref:glycosyltransferase n=1 Tax=Jeotgalibacillus proteolyticus TaxID=2082395 RepID=UPI003CFA48C8